MTTYSHSTFLRDRTKGKERFFSERTGKNELVWVFQDELCSFIDPETGMEADKFLESVPCPAYDFRNQNTISFKHGLRFVRCPECSLVFINPQLRTEALASVYSNKRISEVFIKKVLVSNDQRDFDKKKFLNAYVIVVWGISILSWVGK